jgi:hypothetical protein
VEFGSPNVNLHAAVETRSSIPSAGSTEGGSETTQSPIRGAFGVQSAYWTRDEYPKGCRVQIAARDLLEDFAAIWQFHAPLQPE